MLADFAARLFSQTFGAANTPEDMAAHLAGFSEARQQSELTDHNRVTWIAEHGGAPVGYASLCLDARIDGVSFRRPAEIATIYVDRTWHGHGVGNALMSACLHQARRWNCDGVWLGVWEKNPRAIAFYRRAGFVKVASKPFQLGADLQNDDVMARSMDVTTPV